MAKVENVIKGLEDIQKHLDTGYSFAIPWKSELIRDALALLKEQQQQIWELQDQVEYLTDKLKEQEAVEGHWIPIESPTGVEAFGIKEMTAQDVRCSICDAEEDVSFAAYRFCPRCGAKMEGR